METKRLPKHVSNPLLANNMKFCLLYLSFLNSKFKEW